MSAEYLLPSLRVVRIHRSVARGRTFLRYTLASGVVVLAVRR